MIDHERDITFKNLFIPFTSRKAFAIITIIGFIIFFNGFFNGFVGDDPPLTTENPTVQSLNNLPAFFTGSTFYNGAGQKLSGFFYRPIQTTFFSVIYSLFGANAFAFHFFQILLFIINAFLLFLIFKQFFRKEIALFLSLIFLIHPINSEAALYISVTQEPLFLFFGLSAFLILKTFQSQKAFPLASLFLLLSLLSKEAGILFLILALIYIFIFWRKKFLTFLKYTPFIFGVYIALRINAIGIFAKVTQNAPIEKLNLLARLINLPDILFFYIRIFLFPFNLAVIYQWINTKIDFIHFLFPLTIDALFLITIGFLGFQLYKKSAKKYFYIYAFFAIWLFLGLSLYMQIIPLDMTVSDQWFYFPIIGILGMIGTVIEAYKINLQNKWTLLAMLTILILLSLRTASRSFDFKDSFTLATHDLKISKEAYGLEHELSNIYFVKGNLEQAKLHAERSIAYYPYVFNYTDLGNADFYLGQYEQAEKAYLKALTYGDNYVTYDNLAALAIDYGNPKENINFIKNNALKKYPGDARLWLYLAILDYRSGNKLSAKTEIKNAYLYNQGLPEINQVYVTIINNQPLQFKIGK
jgi:protein O-mannosyl-transferase